MIDQITCRLCGLEFSDDQANCPGCGVSVDYLVDKGAVPPPRGSLNDYPGILTSEQSDELTHMLESHFNLTDVPLIVAIVKSTEPLAPNEYAFLLYNEWGIGRPGLNMGLLVLLCLDRQHVECEVGIGLENFIPEVEGDEILQATFIPYFRERKYFEGLKAGVEVLTELIRRKAPDVRRSCTT